MKKLTVIVLVLCLFEFSCCSQAEEEKVLINPLKLKDSAPPVLQSAVAVDEYSLRITFDKQVEPVGYSFDPFVAKTDGLGILLVSEFELNPSREYKIEGVVKDSAGNTSYIQVKVWGYNPNPAGMLINEFTTKSSGKQVDRTELYVYRTGYSGGFVLYDGIPGNYKNKAQLGNMELKQGDYVVVWWCPELDESVYEHPSDTVWNICSNTKTNPSENNGIQTLSVSSSQGASVVDCVVYSSFESNQYSGYGSKEVYSRVQKAVENGWWKGPAVSSQASTGTRSMFRQPSSIDSDTCNEWNICPTGKSTFGYRNLTETF